MAFRADHQPARVFTAPLEFAAESLQTESIRTEIDSRLRPFLACGRIDWEYHEGVLILRGQVPSFYMKQMAQELVRHVPAVSRVINRLAVEPTTIQRAIEEATASAIGQRAH